MLDVQPLAPLAAALGPQCGDQVASANLHGLRAQVAAVAWVEQLIHPVKLWTMKAQAMDVVEALPGHDVEHQVQRAVMR